MDLCSKELYHMYVYQFYNKNLTNGESHFWSLLFLTANTSCFVGDMSKEVFQSGLSSAQ